MSGSLAHVIGEDGRLIFDNIDGSLKDCGMTIRQMYNIIVVLSDGDMAKVSNACNFLGYVDPYEQSYPPLDDLPMPKPMKISLHDDDVTTFRHKINKATTLLKLGDLEREIMSIKSQLLHNDIIDVR